MARRTAVAVLCLAVVILAVPSVFAAETQAAQDASGKAQNNMYLALAIGFGLAIAVLGGALGQGRAIAAAVEAMARQPEAGGRIQGAMIIGLALIETLVIYMLLIAFMLLGKFVELH